MGTQGRIDPEKNKGRIKRPKKKRKNPMSIWCLILFTIGFFGWKGYQADAASGTEPDTSYVEESPADIREDLQANEKPLPQGYTNRGSKPSPESSTSPHPPKDVSSADNAWQLVLVNGTHFMADGYEPPLREVEQWYYFDARAAESLTQMLSDARKAGLSPKICSAYRSMQKQTTLYNNQVKKQKQKGYGDQKAREEAKTVVAYPGTSEHQLGLAVDIVATDYQILDDKQADTQEAMWLRENCSRYGFILRYPEDKSEWTGVIFEPWHFRYVGQEAAAEIMGNGLCLEEYLGEY